MSEKETRTVQTHSNSKIQHNRKKECDIQRQNINNYLNKINPLMNLTWKINDNIRKEIEIITAAVQTIANTVKHLKGNNQEVEGLIAELFQTYQNLRTIRSNIITLNRYWDIADHTARGNLSLAKLIITKEGSKTIETTSKEEDFETILKDKETLYTNIKKMEKGLGFIMRQIISEKLDMIHYFKALEEITKGDKRKEIESSKYATYSSSIRPLKDKFNTLKDQISQGE